MTRTAVPRAGRREWIGLAVLALACLLYAMDLTVLHLAVPAISADLQPTSAQLLWIIDIYGFMVAGLLVTMGTLGDRIGRRRLLLIGASAFGAASVLAAFSSSSEMLIASRALGVKQIAQDGVALLPIASIVAGLGVGVLFARRQRALTDPMIDLGLFRVRTFNAALATNLLAIFVAVGYFLYVAQYLQLVLGLTPFQAGLWSLPSAAGFIVGSQLGPRIVRRFRPAIVIGVGLVMSAMGLGLLTQVGVSAGLELVVIASVIISLGLAPVFGLTTELIVGSAPPERAGAASGISETGAELGGALGIAILGSIGVAIYRNGIGDGLPAGMPAEAAAIARDTLGAAVGIAAELPEGIQAALLAAARDAFVEGMVVTSVIAGAIAIGLAILAVVVLRDVGSGAEREGADMLDEERSESRDERHLEAGGIVAASEG